MIMETNGKQSHKSPNAATAHLQRGRKLTNVNFAFTPTYLLVKTKMFPNFSRMSSKCMGIFNLYPIINITVTTLIIGKQPFKIPSHEKNPLLAGRGWGRWEVAIAIRERRTSRGEQVAFAVWF